MKTFFLCLMLMSAMAVQVQSAELTDVPANVLKAFSDKYPDAEDVSWKRSADLFTVEFFDFDGYIKVASFAKSGVWVETSTEYNLYDLPKTIQDYLEENFENVEDYDSILFLEAPEVIRYYVNFETDEGTVQLAFNEDGNLMDE